LRSKQALARGRTPSISHSLVLAEKLTWDHYQIVKEQKPLGDSSTLPVPTRDRAFYWYAGKCQAVCNPHFQGTKCPAVPTIRITRIGPSATFKSPKACHLLVIAGTLPVESATFVHCSAPLGAVRGRSSGNLLQPDWDQVLVARLRLASVCGVALAPRGLVPFLVGFHVRT
jgi:hypothetical protein